jgi:DNA-binding SARP family transcriptional activator
VLTVGLLGEVTAHVADRVVALGPLRQRHVLAALAVDSGRVVSVDQMMARIWGEDPPLRARGVLSSYISRLRTAVGSDQLMWRSGGYVLACDPSQVDLHRFRELHESARTTDDAARAVALLTEARALWRGEALTGLDGPWALAERDRIHQQGLHALLDLTDARLRLGDGDELVAELHARAGQYPLNERVAAQYMHALYRAGRVADALDYFRQFRRRLVDELGTDPGAALRELQERILHADPALAAVTERPPSTTLSASNHVPRQLPVDSAHFVGRDDYLDQLDTMLDGEHGGLRNAVVISAIAGVGGVGKTALALRWAHRSAARYPDAQLYVNLRGYAAGSPPLRPADVFPMFLRALGVAQLAIPPSVDEQSALYRSLLAGRRALIVLDNAATADQVRPLLPGTPSCAVLVTSRDDLLGLAASHDVHRLVLDVLTETDALALLARIIGTDRVAAEPAEGAELARMCGYLPLALRIAAAQLVGDPRQSIAGYVAKLNSGDRLSRLAIAQDQDASVRASFDLSYRTIDAQAARLFRRLGCSPGQDCSVAAASALIEAPPAETEQLLERLTSAHLIESPAPGRYTLHDLLRLYAIERAHAEDLKEDRDRALGRLFDMYLQTAGAAVTLMYPTSESILPEVADPGRLGLPLESFDQARTWIDAERPNLVAAVRHAAEHGPRDLTWRLVAVLTPYFYGGMHRADWLESCELALQVAWDSQDQVAEAAILHSLHRLHFTFGDYEKALELGLRSLELLPVAGNPGGESEMCKQFGHTYWLLGRPADSQESFTRARDLYRQLGNRHGEIYAMNGISLCYLDRGRLEDVLDQTGQVLRILREADSRIGEPAALHIRAQALVELGKYEEALLDANQALKMYRQTGFRYNWAPAIAVIALAHSGAGRQSAALEEGYRALSLATEVHDQRGASLAHSALALAHLSLQQHDEASVHIEEAIRVAQESGYRRAYVDALIGLAKIELATGGHREARQHASAALQIARDCGFQGCAGQALAELHRAETLLASKEGCPPAGGVQGSRR